MVSQGVENTDIARVAKKSEILQVSKNYETEAHTSNFGNSHSASISGLHATQTSLDSGSGIVMPAGNSGTVRTSGTCCVPAGNPGLVQLSRNSGIGISAGNTSMLPTSMNSRIAMPAGNSGTVPAPGGSIMAIFSANAGIFQTSRNSGTATSAANSQPTMRTSGKSCIAISSGNAGMVQSSRDSEIGVPTGNSGTMGTSRNFQVVHTLGSSGLALSTGNRAIQTSRNSGIAIPAENAGIALPVGNSGLVQMSRNSGIAMPTQNAGITLPVGNSGLVQTSRNSGIGMPAGNAGMPQMSRNSGIAIPAENAGIALPVGNSGLVQMSRNSGIAMPTQNAGIALPVGNSGLVQNEMSGKFGVVKGTGNSGIPRNSVKAHSASNSATGNAGASRNPKVAQTPGRSIATTNTYSALPVAGSCVSQRRMADRQFRQVASSSSLTQSTSSTQSSSQNATPIGVWQAQGASFTVANQLGAGAKIRIFPQNTAATCNGGAVVNPQACAEGVRQLSLTASKALALARSSSHPTLAYSARSAHGPQTGGQCARPQTVTTPTRYIRPTQRILPNQLEAADPQGVCQETRNVRAPCGTQAAMQRRTPGVTQQYPQTPVSGISLGGLLVHQSGMLSAGNSSAQQQSSAGCFRGSQQSGMQYPAASVMSPVVPQAYNQFSLSGGRAGSTQQASIV